MEPKAAAEAKMFGPTPGPHGTRSDLCQGLSACIGNAATLSLSLVFLVWSGILGKFP